MGDGDGVLFFGSDARGEVESAGTEEKGDEKNCNAGGESGVAAFWCAEEFEVDADEPGCCCGAERPEGVEDLHAFNAEWGSGFSSGEDVDGGHGDAETEAEEEKRCRVKAARSCERDGCECGDDHAEDGGA